MTELEQTAVYRWPSLVAGVFVLVVVSGGLLTLTFRVRSGWLPERQFQMDKAAAIHQLFFRH